MSIASQDSYINNIQSYWQKFNSSESQSTFSTVYVSTAIIENAVIADINNLFLSTQIIEAEEAFVSSISTLGIYLDGSLLTTAGSELLLNGVPIATTDNISTIADWSYDPAISTLNMNNNSSINGSLLSTNTINAGNALITSISASTISTVGLIANNASITNINTSSISSLLLNVSSAVISSLICNDISTITLTVFSTLHVLSTISSVEIEAQSGLFSSINGAQFPQSLSTVSTFENASVSSFQASSINGAQFPQLLSTVSTFENASVSSFTASSINGVQFPQPVDASQWATFPPVTVVTNSTIGIYANQQDNIFTNASTGILAENGLGGLINITSGPGYQGINGGNITLTANGGSGVAGLFGAVNIVANPGSAAGINSGGLVNITANTGVGLCNATSAVKINGGGVNSYAGVIPSFGSVFGYNFVYGSLGVSLCAGLPPSGFQVPGTVFISGTTGTSIYDTLYTTNIYPYWNGNEAPNDLLIAGRTTIIGSASVLLSNVDNMAMEGAGAITGVSSINGAAYPPTFTVPANLTVSSISTLALDSISSINGSSYPPTFAVPTDLEVSSITVNPFGFVSTSKVVFGVNSIEESSLFEINILASSLRVTDATFGPGQINVANVRNVSSINGDDISRLEFVNTAGFKFDTLVSISTIDVSTINGVAYPPLAAVPADLVVSTLTVNPAGIISTPSIALGDSAFVDFAGDTQLITRSLTVLNPSSFYGQVIVGEISQVSSINGGEVPGVPLEFVNSPGFEFNANIQAPSITGLSSIRSSTINTYLLQLDEGPAGIGGIILDSGVVNPFTSLRIFFENLPGNSFSDVQALFLGPTLPSTNSLIAQRYTSTLGAPSTLGSFAAGAFHAEGGGTWASMTAATNTMVISPALTTSSITVSSINGVAFPTTTKQATYYKSVNQSMTSGANDVTFDLSGAWNNDGGYITHTDATTAFTVVQEGLYQLEFNTNIVANGATWGNGSNKTINIDITRSPNGEHAIIQQACLTSSASNYGQSISATYYLVAGDVINLRVFNQFAGGPPSIQGITNTFDFNTFFTWKFVS